MEERLHVPSDTRASVVKPHSQALRKPLVATFCISSASSTAAAVATWTYLITTDVQRLEAARAGSFVWTP